MTVTDILNSVKFVVTPDGHQSAVVVDVDIWEQIVMLLEDAEDAEEIKKARMVKDEVISWKIPRP
jgi:PHD/YefM family antitoxin component YafN of YafNO toxin-antitoxin module